MRLVESSVPGFAEKSPLRQVELTAKGRALITRGFGEHAAAMENVADVLSKTNS